MLVVLVGLRALAESITWVTFQEAISLVIVPLQTGQAFCCMGSDSACDPHKSLHSSALFPSVPMLRALEWEACRDCATCLGLPPPPPDAKYVCDSCYGLSTFDEAADLDQEHYQTLAVSGPSQKQNSVVSARCHG